MEWDMILGHTKLASVPKRYTLKPLFKPETCTSSLQKMAIQPFKHVSVAPVYIEFCSCIISRIRFANTYTNRFLGSGEVIIEIIPDGVSDLKLIFTNLNVPKLTNRFRDKL
jgi:hypothetical protein